MINDSEFNEACGVGKIPSQPYFLVESHRIFIEMQINHDLVLIVGAVVTSDTINAIIAKVIASNKNRLDKERYSAATALLIDAKASPELRWAEPKALKEAFDAQLLAYLGSKDERDQKPSKVCRSIFTAMRYITVLSILLK